MILHFLYITCRKNSLLQGPAIGKGRTAHKKSRWEQKTPGAGRGRGTDCRKNRKEKRSEKSQCTFAKQSASRAEGAAKRDGGAPTGMCKMLCRGSGADNRAESTASGANTPFFHLKQLRVTLQG